MTRRVLTRAANRVAAGFVTALAIGSVSLPTATATATAVAVTVPPAPKPAAPVVRSLKVPIRVDGVARSFRMYVPPTVDLSAPAPLVLVLSGLGRDSSSIELDTDFDNLADHKGFYVAYPDAVGGIWDAGACCAQLRTPTDPALGQPDDVTMLDRVIERVSSLVPVDPGRVFVSGFSNGAMMALRYACARPERISAAASVSGTLETACTSTRPLSLIQISGLHDTSVPFAGATLSGFLNAPLTPTPTTVATFEALDDCSGFPVRSATAALTTRRYPSCAAGTGVALTVLRTGGHQWPTMRNQRYDATAAIWEFFSSHPRGTAPSEPTAPTDLATRVVGSVVSSPTGKQLVGYLDGRFDQVIGAGASVRARVGDQWVALSDFTTDFVGAFAISMPRATSQIELHFLTPGPMGQTRVFSVS